MSQCQRYFRGSRLSGDLPTSIHTSAMPVYEPQKQVQCLTTSFVGCHTGETITQRPKVRDFRHFFGFSELRDLPLRNTFFSNSRWSVSSESKETSAYTCCLLRGHSPLCQSTFRVSHCCGPHNKLAYTSVRCGAVQCGAMWCVWSGLVWSGLVWSGVVWCGVWCAVWCGVWCAVWCGVWGVGGVVCCGV